ncbi:hypothetical protein ACFO9Q_12110 [Paenibacillus sp. GCM10023252]|uniref:hypothetical protein n=1 Tax=Paenibacillus sp. GCM10023252 TaxID=3252649 RepID=UPI00361CBDE4
MKLSGFLLGGIVGAAAIVAVSRKRPGMVAWAGQAASELYSGIVNKSVRKMMTVKTASHVGAMTPKSTGGSDAKSGAGWGHIEAIINSDPKLKQEVGQIVAESSSPASAH